MALSDSLTPSSTQRENHLRGLYGDETSGTAFERGSMKVRSVNVQPNSFIMKIVPAVILRNRGRTSLLVSHRVLARALTAPPRSVHPGSFLVTRAVNRRCAELRGVNSLAPLFRVSSRAQTRANVTWGRGRRPERSREGVHGHPSPWAGRGVVHGPILHA